MFRRLKLVVTWSLAVVVLAGLGPGVEGFHLGGNSAVSTWPSWALAHPDAALVAAAAGLAWLLLAWLAVAYLVVSGSAGVGRSHRWCRRTARVLVPRVVRHGLEAALGLGVAALTATPALATPAGPATSIPSLDRAPATSVRLAPVPAVPAPVLAPIAPPAPTTPPAPATPPASSAPPAPTARPSAPPSAAPLPDVDRTRPSKVDDPTMAGALPPAADEVVVRRGDCLWDVVSRSLGPSASDADVARTWPQWYAHNRASIGADPDLLLPGTVLSPPPALTATP